MRVSTSGSDSDDENNVVICFDPIKMIQSLSILSTMKTATESITLLLQSISIEHANRPRKKRPTTRKRPSDETKIDEDTNKRARKAPEKDPEIPEAQDNSKWKCYICYKTFHNESNLHRHIKNTKIHRSRYCPEEIDDDTTRFRCGFCGATYSNRGNVNRHIKSHHSNVQKSENKCDAKDIKMSVDTSPEVNSDHEEQEFVNVDITMCVFVCEQCEVATPVIDRAVEHAQFHELPGYRPIPQTCQICKYTFEAQDITEHFKIHERDNEFIPYDPLKLLNNEWSDIFQGLDDTLINTIKSSTIYEHTRKVRMNTDDSDDPSSKPLYQCGMCEMHVRPAEVEDHCNKEKACLENHSVFHVCENCDRFFFTEEALSEHVAEEEENSTFKVVTFNHEWDLPINRALRNLQNNLHLAGENSQQEKVSNTTEQAATKNQQSKKIKKAIVVLDKYPITQFCQDCGKFISISELKTHDATHRYNNNATEDEENHTDDEMSIVENCLENNNERGNIPDDNPDGVEIRNENIVDHIANMQEDGEEEIIANNTVRIENVRSIINTASANQFTMIRPDDSFRTIENELRHDLRENFIKYSAIHIANNASKQSNSNNEIIETPDESDHNNDSNCRLPTPSTSSDQNKVSEDNQIVDDKSKLEHIIKAIRLKQLYKTNEIIEISDDENEEEDSNRKVPTPSTSPDLIRVLIKEEVDIEDDKSEIQHIINAIDRQINQANNIFDLTDESEDTAATESNVVATVNAHQDAEENNEETTSELQRIIEMTLKNKQLMSSRD